MANYYETLGIRTGAHPAEIDLAFKAIKQSGIELDMEEQLELSIAHQTLMHPSRRMDYDKDLPKPEVSRQAPKQVVYQQLPNNVIQFTPPPRPANNVLNYFILGYILVFAVVSLLGAFMM